MDKVKVYFTSYGNYTDCNALHMCQGRNISMDSWGHVVDEWESTKDVFSNIQPLHTFDDNTCIGLLPVSPSYSPVVQLPCDHMFANSSYICKAKRNEVKTK